MGMVGYFPTGLQCKRKRSNTAPVWPWALRRYPYPYSVAVLNRVWAWIRLPIVLNQYECVQTWGGSGIVVEDSILNLHVIIWKLEQSLHVSNSSGHMEIPYIYSCTCIGSLWESLCPQLSLSMCQGRAWHYNSSLIQRARIRHLYIFIPITKQPLRTIMEMCCQFSMSRHSK